MDKEAIKPKKTTTKKAKATVTPLVSVSEVELGAYLALQISRRAPIQIRYQSQRKNSANKWRLLSVTSYDSIYITVEGYNGIPYKYRRDRVVEIR